MPKRHFVKAKILGSAAGSCRYELSLANGEKPPKEALIFRNGNAETTEIFEIAPCSGHELKMQLPYRPETRTHRSSYIFRLSAQSLSDDGAPDSRIDLSTNIQVSDYVIVSMGDSFASGEGNPDMPAMLDENLVQRASFSFSKRKSLELGFPRRVGSPTTVSNASSAKWIDRRCHRSMYGAPTRAALALAFLGKRHHAVTYLNFACSGAEVTDGLLWPQSGVECASSRLRKTYRFMEPQVSGVVRELALERGTMEQYFHARLAGADRFRGDIAAQDRLKQLGKERGYCAGWPGVRKGGFYSAPYLHKGSLKREIDLLFLSISGNDVGFAPLIVSATINNVKLFENSKKAWLTKTAREAAGGIGLAEAQKRIDRHLPTRLSTLHVAIEKKLEMKGISERVLLSSYPSITRMSADKYCGVAGSLPRDNLGMSGSYFFSFNDSGTNEIDAKDAEGIVDDLNKKMKDFSRGKWTFVDGYKGRFIGHSICSQDGSGSSNENAENFLLPRKSAEAAAGAWMTDEGLHMNPATEYRHYASRQRWLRTYNDVKLGVQMFKTNAADEWNRTRGFVFDALAGEYNARRSTGGPFHPTAEGHAAIADELVKVGMKRLDLTWD